MCSICAKVLIGFAIPHEEVRCPLRMSRYCSRCARYGHHISSCNTRGVLEIQSSDESIKEFLTTHGIKYGKNIKRALNEYAEVHQLRIVYVV